MEERSVCFRVSGEFLTEISRQLWADEQQPEKAISLLKEGLHGISMEQVFCILTGSKKLIGDSSDPEGIELVDDDAKVSENGFPLDLPALIGRFRAREDKLEDEVQFFSRNTELVSSPKGLVEVPRRRTKRYEKSGRAPIIGLKEDVDLEKIPHRECTPRVRAEKMFQPESQLKRRELGLEPGPEGYNALGVPYDMLKDQEEPPSPPPEPEYEITSDCGWLSPDGKFYRCAYMEHISLAIRLGRDEVRLEKLGWIKVQENKFWGDLLCDGGERAKVTQKQRDLVFDYCTKNGLQLPSWMAPEED